MAEQKTEQKPDFRATPEFKAAVAEAAALAAAHLAEQMKAELMAATRQDGSDQGTMERLALAIAEISDQGTQRKRVAPEVLQARAAANARAIDLILQARENGEKPQYTLVSKVYLNERFIEPFRTDPVTRRPVRQEIVWSGMPNEAMRPINDIAKAIYTEFRASIGGTTQGTKRDDKRPYWISAGGLVVKGDPPAHREVLAPVPFNDDLDVKTPFDPRSPEIHVLGTVAAPAKQGGAWQPGI